MASAAESFRDGLVLGLAALDMTVEEQGVMALCCYHAELKRWSGKMNLIAKNTPDEQILESHFLDSLTLLPLLPKAAHLLDIGTGAGFPGLVCKAMMPSLRLTLVEPRQKRVSFLRHIVRTLELKDVEIIEGRIEDELLLPSETSCSHITSRAVSDIAGFLQMTERFLQPDLRLICMKGPKWQEELAAASGVMERLSIERLGCVERRLPLTGRLRVLIVFGRQAAS